jgi:hypothetical protein
MLRVRPTMEVAMVTRARRVISLAIIMLIIPDEYHIQITHSHPQSADNSLCISKLVYYSSSFTSTAEPSPQKYRTLTSPLHFTREARPAEGCQASPIVSR